MDAVPGAGVQASHESYPAFMQEAEAAWLARRRKAVKSSGGGCLAEGPVGVGLSGGGIRSATFALGVFQALAKRRLVRTVDYLSTVSGGGYFGSFLVSLFVRQADCAAVEALLPDRAHPCIADLRENGNYLAPHGTGDRLMALAVVLRNLISIHVVLGVFALLWFLAAVLAGRGLAWGLGIPTRLAVLPGCESATLVWWAVVMPALVFLWVIPAGWGYWLIEEKALGALLGPGVLFSVSYVWMCYLCSGWQCPTRRYYLCLMLAGTAVCTIYRWLRSRRTWRDALSRPEILAERQRITRSLLRGLTATLLVLVWLGVDLAGSRLAGVLGSGCGIGAAISALPASIVAVLLAVNRAATLFDSLQTSRRLRLSRALPAGIAAALVVVAGLVTFSAVAYLLAGPGRSPWLGLTAVVVCLVLSWLFGGATTFPDNSSLHTLYTARLVRAYLGAAKLAGKANPARRDVTRVESDDDLATCDYWPTPSSAAGPSPADRGAPVHLINVTVNETVSGTSRTQQQDRRGVGMAVGPAGLSLGVWHHLGLDWGAAPVVVRAVSSAPAHCVFRSLGRGQEYAGESLSVGQWTSISGAAFSTGVGARTSLAMCLLCGLANIRLGYWWEAGVTALPASCRRIWYRLSRPFRAQLCLLSEWFARFPGTAEEWWNLSDGGHFENLAGYELIRRRLPAIVLVDAECDPDYSYEGLANLVRKARVDFGAEIAFLDAAELDRTVLPAIRSQFASLDGLCRGRREAGAAPGGEPPLQEPARDGVSLGHAALARVRYAGEDKPSGWLLYVKPSLTGDESADLLQYHRTHADFPHETTADQFFDEAQWESYRALGEHIADGLLQCPGAAAGADRAEAPAARWTPCVGMRTGLAL